MAIIENMPNAEYHAAEGISKTGLDLIDRSPAHFRYAEPREQSRAMVLGSALHAAVLEPEVFKDQYMLLRDVSDRRASAYKEAVKIHGADFVLTGKEADYVSGMQEAVRSHRGMSERLAGDGKAELSVFTRDPETGVQVRCRFDWIASGRALDLKKTQDARPAAFAKSIANYRYHVQAAFYEDVWFWETGERLQAFEFGAVEERLPHGIMIYALDTEAMNEGRRLYRENLNTYAKCLDSGDWHGYNDQPELIALPPWAVSFNDEEIF